MRDIILPQEKNLGISGRYKPQTFKLIFTCWYWSREVLGWKVQLRCERGIIPTRNSRYGVWNLSAQNLWKAKLQGFIPTGPLGQTWEKRNKPALPGDVFYHFLRKISTVFLKHRVKGMVEGLLSSQVCSLPSLTSPFLSPNISDLSPMWRPRTSWCSRPPWCQTLLCRCHNTAHTLCKWLQRFSLSLSLHLLHIQPLLLPPSRPLSPPFISLILFLLKKVQ